MCNDRLVVFPHREIKLCISGYGPSGLVYTFHNATAYLVGFSHTAILGGFCREWSQKEKKKSPVSGSSLVANTSERNEQSAFRWEKCNKHKSTHCSTLDGCSSRKQYWDITQEIGAETPVGLPKFHNLGLGKCALSDSFGFVLWRPRLLRHQRSILPWISGSVSN